MNIFTNAHKKFLLDLIEHQIEFLLIGGYAVNYHGYPRFTLDMDIFLNSENENKTKFIELVKKIGFSENSIKRLESLDFNVAQSFSIGENETRIDFLTKISGVTFGDAINKCAKLPLSDKTVPVIQYEHLVLNKMMSGRPKDIADVDELQKINSFKNE